MDFLNEAVETSSLKANRNDPCPCGSGKKYKKCCLDVAAVLPNNALLSKLQHLQPLIEEFGQLRYGPAAASAAWQHFSRWGGAAIARDEQSYQSAFASWYLFAWLPDDTELDVEPFKIKPSDHAIAYDYLESQRDKLNSLEQSVINTSTKSPYSFYAVISVTTEYRLQLQEIYTGKTQLVDCSSTASYTQGDVIYAAILSVNSMCALLGCMPETLNSNVRTKIEAHREKWRAEEGTDIDQRLLYLHDVELRRFYFMLLTQQHQSQLH